MTTQITFPHPLLMAQQVERCHRLPPRQPSANAAAFRLLLQGPRCPVMPPSQSQPVSSLILAGLRQRTSHHRLIKGPRPVKSVELPTPRHLPVQHLGTASNLPLLKPGPADYSPLVYQRIPLPTFPKASLVTASTPPPAIKATGDLQHLVPRHSCLVTGAA